METRLHNFLSELEDLVRGARLRRRLAAWWAAAAAIGLGLLLIHWLTGWDCQLSLLLVLAGGGLAAVFIWWQEGRLPRDVRGLAAAIERAHPNLRHLLTTAVEQEPNPQTGKLGYLQWRVIEQAVAHPDRQVWEDGFQREYSAASQRLWLALIALVITVWLGDHHMASSARPIAAAPPAAGPEITVTPGDTQVERGTGLVITARFGSTPPAEATLVLVSASGKTQRLPLARQLADPVFGAGLPEIAEDGRYHIEYGAKKTRDYRISVFDFPALTRADALLEYPAYTGLTNRTIPDTLRVSAVTGTRLTYTLQLNKPVVSARFLGESNLLTLAVQTNAVANLNQFPMTNSARYALELVDADGRTNKVPAEFSLLVLPDRPPEVKVVFPHGDQRVSSLQELQLTAETKSEYGLLKYGVGYSVGGQPPEFVESGLAVPAGQSRQFTNQIAMESLGVGPEQLVSYFAWADDHGPDGQVRRTFSDMFFAEVRPFEEIFRADQSGQSANQNQNRNQNQNQGGNQGGNQTTRLAELQKQIVIATWKLQQEKAGATGAAHP